MSEYDVDEQIKRNQRKTTLRPDTFMNYPEIPYGEDISRIRTDSDMISTKLKIEQEKRPTDLIFRCFKNPDNIKNSYKQKSIENNDSFLERVKKGWTKEQLMNHYSISEDDFEKIILRIIKYQ